MVNEKPVTDKALDRAHSIDLPWTGRANDGAGAQSLVDELARLGHDQVGLQRLRLTLSQVLKRHGGAGDGVYKPSNLVRDGRWRRIKIKLAPPRGLPPLQVYARTGYYAPAQ